VHVSDAPAAVALAPLFSYNARADAVTFSGHTPSGHRAIVPVVEATFEGTRFTASQRGPAVDSIITGSDGTAMINVHMVTRTWDGALVHVAYHGRADWSQGIGSAPVRIFVTFETDDDRYTWLNSTLAVGVGAVVDAHVHYDVFEVTGGRDDEAT
jgi:hypothetical protein